MNPNPILNIKPLGFPWVTQDPFLFCVHHADAYPKGNDELGPAASLSGRNLGQDFIIKDGWRMYHGETVPGFPSHPHRGFETITVVLKGFIDHADSLGAEARFGNGDVQWMTAGKGIQHSEMFPLLKKDADNPLELFQIWLNLPSSKKFVEPHFKMIWSDSITFNKSPGIEVTVVTGNYYDTMGSDPTPDSWAADPANEVAIWRIKMNPKAKLSLPISSEGVNRSLYFFKGKHIEINQEKISSHCTLELNANNKVEILNGEDETHLLVLQGKPINEPVAQYGPFVMNNQQEIQQAYQDYQRTQFGGWPWPKHDHVHPRNQGRFARHADGKAEYKDEKH